MERKGSVNSFQAIKSRMMQTVPAMGLMVIGSPTYQSDASRPKALAS